MVLIYISMQFNAIEHLCICLLAICISALEKCLVNSLPSLVGFFFIVVEFYEFLRFSAY